LGGPLLTSRGLAVNQGGDPDHEQEAAAARTDLFGKHHDFSSAWTLDTF
jgi:hypothetical protein